MLFSGAELRQYRKNTVPRITQAEMAVICGISRETVNAIENEHPGTINELKSHVVKLWKEACDERADTQSASDFESYLKNFFSIK